MRSVVKRMAMTVPNPILSPEPSYAHERGGGLAEVALRPNPDPPHVRERRRKRLVRLRRLGFKSYAEYLRSPHWHVVRARYRASDLPQTCICGEPDVHLHHMTYQRIGDERLTDLTPLCPQCHSLIHVLEFRGEIGLDLEGLFDAGRAIEGRALLVELAERQRAERDAFLQQQQETILALPFSTRLVRAWDVARTIRHVDVSSQVWTLKMMVKADKGKKALNQQLRKIEERAYGWDGWA